ncbi:hypothetical protein FVA74_05940 [Salinibacterium sp. dk2585]|uniref:hypothetical protein n=1 Tax=unclassified Salinibacterium TaxID=2632331 RepID=UPI0011C24279|nr:MULTISPECIES: hypothetical protein [unclassified Salinibacterium]QEE61166.1 hypothetical protein FVA74_05940 [Salinibacterium sp. dk2585]TXK53841.1 hypothetical protein FVP63_07390 [Salinibacterium sp. dk5596]
MRTEDDRAPERIQYLLAMFESIESNSADFYDLAAEGSELVEDDHQLAPFQASHLVGHCLAVSIDALRTVRLVLRKDDAGGLRVPMIGAYPLLRTVIEASSLAVWLLAPADQTERLKRVLRTRMDDILHDDRFVVTMTAQVEGEDRSARSRKQKTRRANSTDVRAKKRLLRDLAAAAGINSDEINTGLPGFGYIIEQAAPELGLDPNLTRGTWSFVSGLTHPSVSRSLMGSSIEWVNDDSQALITANLDNLAWAMDAALNALLTALRLTSERGGRPEIDWTPGPDFPPPSDYTHMSRPSDQA